MSLANRPRRVQQSSVNSPTAIQVSGTSTLSNDQVQKLIDDFIEENDKPASLQSVSEASSSHNPANLSQLKRLQRELRGLPPMLMTEELKADAPMTEQVNKKIKFDDDEPTYNNAIIEDEGAADVEEAEEKKKKKKEKKEKKHKKEKTEVE